LYAGQRSVAQTLQHSLLPDRMPTVAWLDLAFRYLPGAVGVDIGGDWYDAIPLDDDRLMIVVGDVSGRGLQAGTVMASLRYSIRAFASQGDMPSTVLSKLTRLLDVGDDHHFATVLCAVADIPGRTITVANAGHPNPILIAGSVIRPIKTKVGLPIGVTRGATYDVVTDAIPPQSTLLVFTDGVFERRGESVDDGFARLRESASSTNGSLDELLTRILNAQMHDSTDDDTAILGVRWQH
jgi:serine phosphatase RsbU (regulator of sigma subunit)